MTKSFAPGRICLLGDKNDLLGGPVIAAAISQFSFFEISLSDDNNLYFFNSDLNKSFSRPFDTLENDDFFKFLSQICWRLKDKIKPIKCVTHSTLPIGAGVSSSASCSVGFIRGLSKLFDLKMTNREIAEFAFQVERNDLGIACGRMDQYSISYGGATFIETGVETNVIRIRTSNLPFIVGNSCEPRQAKIILNKTMKYIEDKNPEWLGYFKLVDLYVREGYDALTSGDFKKLGELMNKHQEVERKMCASTPRIDAMCEAALSAGALGAKQIGAGGGGCMIALAPGNPQEIIAALQKCGGEAFQADLFEYPQDSTSTSLFWPVKTSSSPFIPSSSSPSSTSPPSSSSPPSSPPSSSSPPSTSSPVSGSSPASASPKFAPSPKSSSSDTFVSPVPVSVATDHFES